MKEASQPLTARSLLVDWANDQDGWVRSLLSEVIVTGKALADGQIDSIYRGFLMEKELAPGDKVNIPRMTDEVSPLDVTSGLFLTELGHLKNVNALAEAQEIRFNPRLTVIFGENACGKTGYVRVLKRVAAVRTAENILSDVTRPQEKKMPCATISYRLGQDEPQKVEWNGDTGVAPFNRIDVFDSRATALHVDGDLNYIYTPGELARFPWVQQGIEGVRQKLDAQIVAKTRTTNPFLQHFDRLSRLYASIELLGASTNLAQLQTLAVVTEAERQEIPTLRSEVEALQSDNPAAQLRLAETIEQDIEALLRLINIFGPFDVQSYNVSLALLREAEGHHDRVTRDSFAGLPIPGLLQEEWRRFVQAGEAYLQTLDNSEGFPVTGEECLYCRQSLSAEAASLIRKYRDYCNNQLRTELEEARRAAGAFQSRCQADFADAERRVSELVGNSALKEAEITRIRTFLTQCIFVRDAVQALQPVEWGGQAGEVKAVRDSLEAVKSGTQTLLGNLSDRRAEREAALKTRRERLLDLESRQKLAGLMPQLEEAVEAARWVDRAKTLQRKFQGLLRSLTETSKVASEQLLNRDFENRFLEECRLLRAPSVTLQFPGKQGQVTRKKAAFGSASHRPSDVLSEGEQKVIGLADFLAEIALKPAAPVIFDDPINSLDYRRMSEVVRRLVKLSLTRQVIVFTHNIWFTIELLAAFDNTQDAQHCSYYDVGRDELKIGIVSKGNHPRSDTYNNLKGRINNLLQEAGKATGEIQAALIEKAYELIRSICEVIVESELLQGVTQRYQPNVMMTRLPNIRFDRLEAAVAAITPIFENCCRNIGSHSQPLETLNVRPTFADLKADWTKVQELREAYKKTA